MHAPIHIHLLHLASQLALLISQAATDTRTQNSVNSFAEFDDDSSQPVPRQSHGDARVANWIAAPRLQSCQQQQVVWICNLSPRVFENIVRQLTSLREQAIFEYHENTLLPGIPEPAHHDCRSGAAGGLATLAHDRCPPRGVKS
jgi:hypothetical protein